MIEKSANDETLQEQLVAYLDGELDAESSRQIDALLAADPKVRQTLAELDRTWRMLESLEATPVEDRFTRSTLEMAVAAAAEEVQQEIAQRPRRLRRRVLGVAGLFALAAGLGCLAVVALRADPNGELIENLPVIENLDLYVQAGDVEFLRELVKQDILSDMEGIAAGAAPVVPGDETRDQRRQRIEAMPPAEQAQLKQRWERYRRLSPEEKEKLAKLQAAIAADPDRDALLAAMWRYAQWLSKQEPYVRAEVAGLDAARRAELVKKRAVKGTPEDRLKATKWLERYVAGYEPQAMEAMPEDRRAFFKKIPPEQRQKLILWSALGPRRAGFRWMLPITDDDLAPLRDELSPKGRRALEGKPLAEQLQVVFDWVRLEFLSRSNRPPGGATAEERFDEKLIEFFEKELSEKERDRLLGLSGDELYKELRRQFLESKALGGHEGSPFGHGKRPGPRPGFPWFGEDRPDRGPLNGPPPGPPGPAGPRPRPDGPPKPPPRPE